MHRENALLRQYQISALARSFDLRAFAKASDNSAQDDSVVACSLRRA